MHLDKFAGTVRSLFHRLLGAGGSEVCEATTATGKFHTLYVATTAIFTAVVGGGPAAQTWLAEIPAGTTLTAASGTPVTSFTLSSGMVIAYS